MVIYVKFPNNVWNLHTNQEYLIQITFSKKISLHYHDVLEAF